jgi:hypothetical protein
MFVKLWAAAAAGGRLQVGSGRSFAAAADSEFGPPGPGGALQVTKGSSESARHPADSVTAYARLPSHELEYSPGQPRQPGPIR